MKTNFKTLRRSCCFAAGSLLASMGVTHAAITQYEGNGNKAAFLSNITGSETATFTGLGAPSGNSGFYGSPKSFDQATFDFTATSQTSAGGFSLYVTTSGATPFGNSLSTGTDGDNLVLTFTTGSPKAIGGDFFMVTAAEASVSATFTIRAFDGTDTSDIILTPGAGSSEFAGFTTTQAGGFQTLTFMNSFGTGTDRFSAMDNIVIGTPVPEAPTWIAASLLSLVAGLRVWRKRQ